MIARKYETRLDENGLVAFEKFGPKGWIVTIRIINSEIRMRYINYVKLLNWTLMQKNMYFYSFSISKCILNRSLRWVLELIALVLLTEEV